MVGVRELCRLMGIRQKELAASLNMKPAQMNVYFQGKAEMRAERMIELLKILGLDIEKQIQDKINEMGGESKTANSSKILASMGGLHETNRKSLLKIIKMLGAE